MTQLAPAAMALVISPEYLMPPSAMIGTPVPFAAREASMMAVSWGTPAPVTTRVVQMEPGPMPTLRPSTPSAMRSFAPSYVATLPAMICISGRRWRIALMASMTFAVWPWAVSIGENSSEAGTARNGQARDAVLGHDFESLAKSDVWRNGDGVDDHARFGPFHAVDFFALTVDGHVAVNDADAALARDGNGEA